MRRLIPITLVATLLPQMVFAAWWNPFSWSIFHRHRDVATTTMEVPPAKQQTVPKSATNSAVAPIQSSDEVVNSWVSYIEDRITDLQKGSDVIQGNSDIASNLLLQTKSKLDGASLGMLQEVVSNYIFLNNIIIGQIQTKIDEFKSAEANIKRTHFVDAKVWNNKTGDEIATFENSVVSQRDSATKTYQNGVGIVLDYLKANNSAPSYTTASSNTTQNSSQSSFYNLCMGVDNDVRGEITSSGGFATESQVEALVHNRRQALGCYNGTIPTAVCSDYTASYSTNRSGTCSDHGGVYIWY